MKRISMKLRTPLQDTEVAKIGNELADKVTELERVREERAIVYKQYKEKVMGLQEIISEYADRVHNKSFAEDVECEVRPLPGSKRVEIIRLDTGEQVESRAMTDEEKQQEFYWDASPQESAKNAKAFLKKKGKRDAEAATLVIDFPEDFGFTAQVRVAEDTEGEWLSAIDWESLDLPCESTKGDLDYKSNDRFDTRQAAISSAVNFLKDWLDDPDADYETEKATTIKDILDKFVVALIAGDPDVETGTADDQMSAGVTKEIVDNAIGKIEAGGEAFDKRAVKETKIKFPDELNFGAAIKVAEDSGFHYGWRIASTSNPKASDAIPVYVDSVTYTEYPVMVEQAGRAMINSLVTNPRFKTMTRDRVAQITKIIEAFCAPEEAQAVAAD